MPKAKRPQLRIGISGWTYAPWRGVFYPKNVAQTKELQYASRQVNSIEINGSFYSLQRPSSYQKWHEATPDDFVFAVKGGRYITHMRRLKNVREPLANFLASGILNLNQKLGPILWQLPPNFVFDASRIDAFFKLLPRDTRAAVRLASKHHNLKKDRVALKTDQNRPLRYAMEVRHESFETPEFVALLRKHNIALVIADTAGKWPFGEDITADFVYLRLHGDEELYVSGYTNSALDRWAKRIKQWSTGKQPSDAKRWSKKNPPKAKARDVFVYFDNDVKVKSPSDAMSLAYRLGKSAQGEAVIGKENTDTPKLTNKALSERVKSHWPAKTRRRGA
jgi:uncharacterized protein YecE (DUF72 family)